MVSAGTPFLLSVEHGVQEGTVRDPERRLASRRDHAGRPVVRPDRPRGPLHADDRRESRGPVRRQPAGRRRVEHPAPAAAGRAAAHRRARWGTASRYQRELWPFLLALADADARASRASSTGGGRPRGGWRWPLRASDRWALGSRAVALAPPGLGAHPAHSSPDGSTGRTSSSCWTCPTASASPARETGVPVGDVGAGRHEGRGPRPGSSPSGRTRSSPSRSGRRRPSAVRSRRRRAGSRTSPGRSSSRRPPSPGRGEPHRRSCRTAARTRARRWWRPRPPRTPASPSTTRRSG